MPNTELQRTIHEASKADRGFAKEAGKEIGRALDKKEKKRKDEAGRRQGEDLEYAGKLTQRHVDRAPKYFYFEKL